VLAVDTLGFNQTCFVLAVKIGPLKLFNRSCAPEPTWVWSGDSQSTARSDRLSTRAQLSDLLTVPTHDEFDGQLVLVERITKTGIFSMQLVNFAVVLIIGRQMKNVWQYQRVQFAKKTIWFKCWRVIEYDKSRLKPSNDSVSVTFGPFQMPNWYYAFGPLLSSLSQMLIENTKPFSLMLLWNQLRPKTMTV
jgi:hypothetical protein